MTSIRSFVKQLIIQRHFVTIVSGLPRSGTSMMMGALGAGGMPLLTDGERRADENNPKGYYEFERVKQLPNGDIEWLKLARGKAVKVISGLLEYLPGHYEYRIIFMERDMDEILDSQKRMLGRKGTESQQPVSEVDLRRSYQAHLGGIHAWLADQGNIKTLSVSYNEVMAKPYDVFYGIADFLEGRVDPRAMTTVVDPRLYREKKGNHSD
jgi:hypothetical protein